MSTVITSMLRTVWRPSKRIMDTERMSRCQAALRPQPLDTVCSSIMYSPANAGR